MKPANHLDGDAALRGRIRLFWVLTATLVVGSVLLIPLLPYTMENYTPQLLYAVIPAQIAVVVLAIFLLKRKLFASRSSSDRDRVSL